MKTEKYEFEVWTLAYELECREGTKPVERARAAAGEAVKAYREARAAWVPCSLRLPDSDDWVLAASSSGNYLVARLEFSDDSEGNGEPYWEASGGDLMIQDFPYWMPLPASPRGA
jgi:hypothetical protein